MAAWALFRRFDQIIRQAGHSGKCRNAVFGVRVKQISGSQAMPDIRRGITSLCLTKEFLMLIKFSPETLKLLVVSFCTFVCSTTAIIVAVTPFGTF
jgi:hypothetical protein